MEKKNQYKYVKKNFYEHATDQEIENCFSFAKDYVMFLNNCKTERETSHYLEQVLLQNNFKQYNFGDKLHVGDKRYMINRNKGIIAFKIGKNDIEKNGVRIVASHIDSPRLDLKQVPMFENGGFCFLKTHYYGGIKKYQWTTIPLSLHGVVFTKNGQKVEVNIGENDNDPVFYINDLLPHLSQHQMKQNANDFISGEQLNIVIGSIPLKEDASNDKIKANILNILNKKYNIEEEDFISAELCAVPAMKAKDVGLDRGLISAYGHDDRVCAYAALQALLNVDNNNTSICFLVDKEEIGSEGVTGIKSKIYEDVIAEICLALNKNVRAVRNNSMCISADVTGAYDPNFADVFEKNNSAMLSCGTCINKYTGGGGKSGANDASAEMVEIIRTIFNENNVNWQCSELGKIDLGGGGTVAKFVAQLNIETIDIGVPVISMHAPYEVISKADLYNSYLGYKAFLK